ncbi:hypothetical protein ABEB36_010179 [Hypothenemus hampei]|uniref:Uncharacterized protein n=1 Tax=Hypothenemus hampei TaxID=57062 RepID=A0ABD1EIS4_HYPHA
MNLKQIIVLLFMIEVAKWNCVVSPLKTDSQLFKKVIAKLLYGQVCFSQDNEFEDLRASKAVSIINFDINKFPPWIYCDSYLFFLKEQNLRRISQHLLPHKQVIVVPNNQMNEFNVDSELIFERAIQMIIIDQRNDSTLNVTWILEKRSELVFDHENIELKQQKWDPKEFFKRTGRKIVVTTFNCPPFVEIQNNKFEGIEFKIMAELLKEWPVKYEIIEDQHKNKLVNKFLIAMERVKNKKSDIAFCFLWQRALMERNLDYSSAMFRTCVTFLVHRPVPLSNYTFLFQAFSNMFNFFIFVLSVLLLESLNKYFLLEKNIEIKKKCENFKIEKLSSKICIISTATFYFLFFSYYSSQLTKLSSFPKFSPNYINSFNDMVKHEIQWAEPANDIQTWMKATNDSTLVGISKNFKIEEDKDVMNMKLRMETQAILVKRFTTTLFSGVEDLDDYGRLYLRSLPGCLATFYSSLAFPKHSPFTFHMNTKLSGIFEGGLSNYWEKITSRKPEHRSMTNFRTLYISQMEIAKFNISKLAGVFYVLIFGYVLSLLCFIKECLKLH